MARHVAKPPDPAQPAEACLAAPEPPDRLLVTLTGMAAGQILHRIHQDKYRAGQFNRGVCGNARFSPIRDQNGKSIPTLYAGSTMDCALMETVFHDVPHTPGFKSVDKAKLACQVHSIIELVQPLILADLASVPLRKLGITRKQLIDTEKDQYPVTRKWAEAIHRQCQQAQGLSWVSRQDDSARAVMLFGDRIQKKALRQQGKSRILTEDSDAYYAVLELADKIGVVIILGDIR